MSEVASIVLFGADLDRTLAFWRALGVDFEAEDHGDGVRHAATDLAGVHMAVFGGAGTLPATPSWRDTGTTFVGLWVASLDEVLDDVKRLSAPVLIDHQQRAWGCRAVVQDPDGRAVEINQRDHCPETDAAAD